MKVRLRRYDDRRDFSRIRDFLVDTYAMLDRPVNWRLERWNYARYFVIPMIGAYAKDPVSPDDSIKAIRMWADSIRLWEDSGGNVVAVTALEYPWLGDVFFLRHPDYDALLGEMFQDAEERLVHPEEGTLRTHIYEHDEPLKMMAQRRGYQRNADWFEEDTEFVIQGELPKPDLPAGFVLQSMADENDLGRRRKAFGRGFNHEDPREWPNLFSYQELQKAPDYHQEQDLYVVAPDGEFVSFCILWWDERNRMGILEPVGTVPEHRRRGLARAVVSEAIRQAAALGAEKVVVGAGLEFYLALGFKRTQTSYVWLKEF
jgi:ribosomal protein S18 acetylase RimI-like enzyme